MAAGSRRVRERHLHVHLARAVDRGVGLRRRRARRVGRLAREGAARGMTGVTRSMEATAAEAAAGVARQRRTTPNGWWGMALLIATEFTLFGSLIASYFYLRFQNSTWPPGGIENPSVTLPLVFTAIL